MNRLRKSPSSKPTGHQTAIPHPSGLMTAVIVVLVVISQGVMAHFFGADFSWLFPIEGANRLIGESADRNRELFSLLTAINALILILVLLFYFRYRKLHKAHTSHTLYGNKLLRRSAKCRQALKRIMTIDPATSLPNHHTLKKRLTRPDHPYRTLIRFDIDAFHQINNLYGEEIGDRLLHAITQRLKKRYDDGKHELYRLRSDEFAIAITENIGRRTLVQEMTDLVAFFNHNAFEIDSLKIHASIHAGGSMERAGLLSTAAMALKAAKNSHHSHLLYDPRYDQSEKYRRNVHWTRTVREALEENRVTLHYQPIVNANDNSINYYECLVRITDRDGSLHYPSEFLPVIKGSKLYFDVTLRIIDLAFKSFRSHPANFSINLSYDDIANPVVLSYLMEKIRHFPAPERIHIEILESEEIKNYEFVRSVIEELHAFGCSVSLDDFGSGHSNFEHLLHLDFDMIKIDGSLVKNIVHDADSQLIVETIVGFAKKLRLATCVEYVHSEEACEFLRKLGVTYLQGYYLSRPKPYH